MPRAIYLHVPFCEQICHYCDFNKFFLKNQPIDEYIDDVLTEMARTVEAVPPEGPIESIYVGGGTPTSLSSAQLERLLLGLRNYFPISPEAEWTVEVNPGSADQEKLQMMAAAGVNRLSIGAQTFDSQLLQTINRDHQPGDVLEQILLARQSGITNISVDMMYALPGQTMVHWDESLNELLQLPVTHVSAYALKIEAKTVFYQWWRKGQLSLPEEEFEALMYERMRSVLSEAGLNQYEISNFAVPGYESSHNRVYWQNKEYYGLGAGAHGYTAGVRTVNHGPLPKYMRAIAEGALPYLETHRVTKEEQMEEFMFMGLRMRSGVSRTEFFERYNIDVDDAFPEIVPGLFERGLLNEDEGRLFLTEDGLLLGNEVFEKFLLG
ncbi:radical SAM family heme chaperone HemW [Salisediminibacterium halotolerans]|uniref:Heme chaperone HemW n=1 Tax=Salisediminibacterium halotolerans TaxID=517425 RepID=A0A1H9S595_9BACI|nr:radical SAM family heme chaperone HemW [Salisediminibacterium haloalkalitolerans]SER80140.1 oxygen-independent coproporphyrinogen-3 oxidase [Salisediminibacterium haloalkalitolerans]